MLASEEKKTKFLRPTEFPSSLPVSSSTKTLNTPKRPAKEVIGQIHRRLSSSNFDSPNGYSGSSIPLRVAPPAAANSSNKRSMQRTGAGKPKPPPIQVDQRRLSYTTSQEPFVNHKSIRKSVIYPSSSPAPGPNQQQQLDKLEKPRTRHYQYHQAPESPVAVVPARPLSFSRPRSARASFSPPVFDPISISSNNDESIPPVPPLPEQVVIGKYKQMPPPNPNGPVRHNQRSVSNDISSNNVFLRAPRRNSHQNSIDQGSSSKFASRNPYRNSSSGVLKVPKSQTTNDLTRYASPTNPLPPTQNNQQSKSPYRPLNRPGLLHPHQSEKTAENANGPAVPFVTRIRSKSTAAKHWIGGGTGGGLIPPPPPTAQGVPASSSTISANKPRSGQTSAAATRRMMFSPFKKRPAADHSAGATAVPQSTTSRSSPDSDPENTQSPAVDDRYEREIREIMKRLVTSKPEEVASKKRMEEYRRHGQQAQPSMTPAVATKNYRLNLYEKGEILDFRKVYFCGRPEAKKISGDIRRAVSNYGFDDDKGDYKVISGDHIAYRYEILGVLGKGSFGKVVKCVDHKTGKLVAVKMIINRKRFHMQALVEADILKSLANWDAKDKYHLVRYTEHFNFRDHLCISTELLGINLYELIKYNQYKGLPAKLVKHFTRQMLEALRFLESKTIIHCDLKPENVLICDPERGKVKIIDFGSSCYESERVYTYIQSRFYRSPEVMLGMSYTQQIDVWSLGCIVAELLTGRPLFMGENEQEQVACIMEIFGLPDRSMISRCARRKFFFDSMGNPRMKTKEKKVPNSRTLQHELRTNDPLVADFIARTLVWNPKQRTTPSKALKHEWITGIPEPTQSSLSSSLSTSTSTSSSLQTPTPPPSLSHQFNSRASPRNSPQPHHPQPPPASLPQPPPPPPHQSMHYQNAQHKASPRQMQQRGTPAGRRELRAWQ